MSRIGRLPVSVPSGVTVEYKDRTVTVAGPLGSLKREILSKNIDVKVENGAVSVSRSSEIKEAKAKHGLYRVLIANMVKGVVTPYSKTLIVNGVGFKCAVNGKRLVMNIGFSHPVEFDVPAGIDITCPNPNEISVKGIDKEQVGQIAASIRAKRPVEPYHAYGIRYSDEVVVKKEGKTAGK